MKNVNTTLTRRARFLKPRTRRSRKANAVAAAEYRLGTMPSAREWFPYLRERLLDSRPIIGHTPTRTHADGSRTGGDPIYGAPTFRNRINRHGQHV